MTEKEVTRQIEDYLNKAGIFYWKNWAGGRGNKSYSKAGISDILGCYKGRMLAIEIKAPGKKPKKPNLQTEFIDSVNRQGGIGFFADCLDDVVEGLK